MRVDITMGTHEQVEAVEKSGVKFVSAELHKCDRGDRKFEIGQALELFGLEEYPELDGEIVEVTAYRETHGDLNGYYIKSCSGNVERWLNWVYEKRLRPIASTE